MELRVFVEAAIDFPDEDVEFLDSPAVRGRLSGIVESFERSGAPQARAARCRKGSRS